MKNKLAIIIPAYKACFFREVLDSIVRQSNRDFTVYIGDDASPDDLESIVSDYKDKLDIFYFRFEQIWLPIGNAVLNYLMSRWYGFFQMMI